MNVAQVDFQIKDLTVNSDWIKFQRRQLKTFQVFDYFQIRNI